MIKKTKHLYTKFLATYEEHGFVDAIEKSLYWFVKSKDSDRNNFKVYEFALLPERPALLSREQAPSKVINWFRAHGRARKLVRVGNIPQVTCFEYLEEVCFFAFA